MNRIPLVNANPAFDARLAIRQPGDRGWARLALLAAHCAGMVDLAALPVWMEVLISDYRLGPQRAGALVSIFLLAAVASTLHFAPRFGRLRGARASSGGFALAALAFAFSATTSDFLLLCVCYSVGGAAVGCALSAAHGTIGRSSNAHRLFAIAGAAFGFFAIAFFGIAPQLIARFGGAALFWLFAAVMAIAAMLCWLAFPSPPPDVHATTARRRAPLGSTVWSAIAGVSCMALTQALIASFLQRIGLERGFGAAAVNAVLVALAVVTLLPAPLAGWLQGRLSARPVLIAGPGVQVAVALVITEGSPFWAFAIAGALLTSVQIFVHTYAFGLIARIDATGRAAAATPAMLMTGSALGPFLAGTLFGAFGHPSLGYAALAFGTVATLCFSRATQATGARP